MLLPQPIINTRWSQLGRVRVTELKWNLAELNGQIPPDLAKLTALRVLDLSGNDLTGPVPPDFKDLNGKPTTEIQKTKEALEKAKEKASTLGNADGVKSSVVVDLEAELKELQSQPCLEVRTGPKSKATILLLCSSLCSSLLLLLTS